MKTTSYSGSNINIVKVHNLQAVLLYFLRDEKISRVELARKTSLSTTTITNLTAELLNEGIIEEEEIIHGSPKRQHVGRPRTMLRLVPEARYAIGIHIGIGIYRVAITDLRANFVHNTFSNFNLETAPETVINHMAKLVQEVIADSGVDPDRIIGIGVGASGLVDYENGVNVLSARLGWHNVPIKNILEEQLNLPVCVDNNVRCMALGEAYFGDGRDVSVLAFVYGRIGVGAGIVINGQVFRGSGAGAGEIGHTIMLSNNGELCTCGNKGCLETLVSERLLIREALQIAKNHPDSLLAKYLDQRKNESTLDLIFAAACDGDVGIKNLIDELSTSLGIALSNLVNVINPELIVLGGMFAQGCDLILPVAERTMREKAFGGLGEKVRIQLTSFGWRAGVTGAASLALMTYFYNNGKGY